MFQMARQDEFLLRSPVKSARVPVSAEFRPVPANSGAFFFRTPAAENNQTGRGSTEKDTKACVQQTQKPLNPQARFPGKKSGAPHACVFNKKKKRDSSSVIPKCAIPKRKH